MNPRTKLAFFNDDEDEDLAFQSKPLDDNKAKTYTQGNLKKSKREKEREAEEAKKREEERDAAKAYAEFLDAFDGPETGPSGTPRGASSTYGSRGGTSFVKAGGQSDVYVPSISAAPTRDSAPTAPRSRPAREPSPPVTQPKPKGKRAMDAFLEELKRDQAEREQRLKRTSASHGKSVSALAAYEGQVGSRDRGDPLTTNVFVGNLPSGVTEQSLGTFFAKLGPVGSVKIMWPRGDPNGGPGGDITSRRGKSAGMSGFVSFMTRESAEACVREMDGHNWGGSVLRVGWSKAVPIAPQPMYVLEDYENRDRTRDLESHRPLKRGRNSRSRSRSRGRYSSKSRSHSRERSHRGGTRMRSHSRERRMRPLSRSRSRSPARKRPRSHSRSRSRDRTRRRSASGSYSHSRSRSPYSRRHSRRSHSRSPGRSRPLSPRRRTEWAFIDEESRVFISTVADRIKEHGSSFEKTIREKEKANPKFDFLFDTSLPVHHFFKCCTDSSHIVPYSILGFQDEGDMSVYSTDSAEESEKERSRKGKLGRIAQKRLETMLRSMTGRRGEMAKCMAFCLEHADAVTQVVDIITSSLMILNTAVPRKLARLYVICDILHNSAATIPNAWKYRQEFQNRLPTVFDHLSLIYQSFPGRITADTFKKQILAVVEVWEDWIVFPPDYTNDLRQRLEGKGRVSSSTDASEAVEEVEVDSEAPPETSTSSKFKTSTFQPAAEPSDEDDMEIDSVDEVGDDLDGGDIEGEAL